MKGKSMKAKFEQPTYPFLFAARNFAANTHTEHLVLFYLISRLRDGTCYPRQDVIAYETQMTERAVQYGIAALKAKGVVTIEKDGRNNVYRLHLDAIQDKKNQRPPMPETPEPVEPPTTKNIFIGGKRLGKTNHSSPIEAEGQDEEHTDHMNYSSPISEIPEPIDKNTRTQCTCKKTVEEDIKTKKTVPIQGECENVFSENQGHLPQADAVPQSATTNSPNVEVLTFDESKGNPNPSSPIEKPRIALHEAKRQVEQQAGWSDLVCTKCWRVGAFDKSMGEGCQSYGDDGVSCGGTGMPTAQWLSQLEAQWTAYNKQIMASTGVSVKDIVGRLDMPSMEKQQDIAACRVHANTLNIGERRTWAKELFDSGSRGKVRRAWYMWAAGMLDDDDEAQSWVTQLFADLEALQPRDGETK
jgi:DNA-binding transcriptional ArsR family regulator